MTSSVSSLEILADNPTPGPDTLIFGIHVREDPIFDPYEYPVASCTAYTDMSQKYSNSRKVHKTENPQQ